MRLNADGAPQVSVVWMVLQSDQNPYHQSAHHLSSYPVR